MAKRRFTYGVYPQGALEVADGAHRAATQDLINVFGYGVPLPDDKKKRRKSSVRGVICKPCITESERGEPKVEGEAQQNRRRRMCPHQSRSPKPKQQLVDQKKPANA